MKKRYLAIALMGISFFGFKNESKAQSALYNNGFGLMIDAGDGTMAGPSLKHYFNAYDAGQAMILFGNNSVLLGAEYTYNKDIDGVNNLKWNVGVGPQISFYSHNGYHATDIHIRPQAGLEYKLPRVPFAMGFDWRPMWTLTHGGDFDGARFGIAFKYTF